MVTAFVDTNILVDVLRGHPTARPWLQKQSVLGITPIAWMELVEGAENRADQRSIVRLLTQFEIVYLTEADMKWAMEQLIAYELSHGVGMMDCLIASVCHRLQTPLFTHNLKHLTPLLGDLAQKPY